jgi:putative Mn2+ efflux pump MntP
VPDAADETALTVFEILLLAVGLAMDAFAVSLAGGAGGRLHQPRSAIRLAFHLGLFQFMMPIIGWILGSRAVTLVGGFGGWIAFALLAFIGIRMVLSGFRPDTADHRRSADPSRGWTLVALSVATSIDALAVGVSLAMVGVGIWQPSVIIGVVTAAISLIGIAIGDRVGSRWGPRVEIMGGLLLVAIGVRIVIGHL